MKKLLLLSVFFLAVNALYASSKDPVAVLFQVNGKVEYTKDGKQWKKVRRNKFLFSGYQVKTGPKGSGMVTIQESGDRIKLSPNSLINVTKEGLKAVQGDLASAESSSKLMQGLMKKFTRSQSYTTIRRGHEKNTLEIDAVRELTLTDDYPFLVWSNIGDKYNYKLTVGDSHYSVPASADKIIRVKLKPFVGKKNYKIEAIKDGKTVVSLQPFQRRGEETQHSVRWMSPADEDQFQKDVKSIQETYGENSFMLGSFFERQDMWVAAMDQYQHYLREYPDEIEMTPYLFRVYKILQLDDIYKTELAQWKKAMQE